MNVGFNHNIMYKGDVFHIQTEDSGVNNPHIITLLYRGGTIISSKKTSYADILKMENLERIVEGLMKEQHKDMLRRLKGGEFDGKAFPSLPQPSPAKKEEKPQAVTPRPELTLTPNPTDKPQEQIRSLDEVILNFLMTGEDK